MSVRHTNGNFDELITMVTGEVAKVFGKQRCIEERHLGTINGLNFSALITHVSDLATDAIADYPIADTQSTRHELNTIDEVVEGVLESETNTSRETASNEAQRVGGDMQRQHDEDDVSKPNQHTDDAVAQRHVDFIVTDGLAMVFLPEKRITALLPDGM